MEIFYLKSVDSTHKYLQEFIKQNTYKKSIAVFSSEQTAGVGSRDNSWEGSKDNFYLSFVIKKDNLPKDLPLQSASIYFSFILKEILKEFGSKVFLKWPNDFYIEDKKIGGTITNLSGELLYCGIGLNLNYIEEQYGYLDIQINNQEILKSYFTQLENYPSWKYIFSKYKVEFLSSKKYKTTVDGQKISLSEAILEDDGSLLVNNKKVFSLR